MNGRFAARFAWRSSAGILVYLDWLRPSSNPRLVAFVIGVMPIMLLGAIFSERSRSENSL